MSDRHISYSQLSKFMSCPLAWKLAQEARAAGEDGYGEPTWPMKVGTVVHMVMEMFHHPDYNPREVKDLGPFMAAALVDQPLLNEGVKDPLSYLKDAERCVASFVSAFGADDNWH